jgi:hypothetical protein
MVTVCAVPRTLTVLLATLALVFPIAALGCGDDDGGGGSGNTLSTEDNLKVDQGRADIDEFCTVSKVGKGDLYDRAFFAVVGAVDQLVIIYKKDTDAAFHEPLKKRDIEMRQLVTDSAKKLKGCGKDGQAQSEKLSRALQSG